RSTSRIIPSPHAPSTSSSLARGAEGEPLPSASSSRGLENRHSCHLSDNRRNWLEPNTRLILSRKRLAERRERPDYPSPRSVPNPWRRQRFLGTAQPISITWLNPSRRSKETATREAQCIRKWYRSENIRTSDVHRLQGSTNLPLCDRSSPGLHRLSPIHAYSFPDATASELVPGYS